MDGVRGEGKQPGIFRDVQVFVGSSRDSVDTARYIPPVPSEVPWLIDDWLSYVNDRRENALFRAAMAHYQFETIHPFRDGNGRMGRLLIMMMLRREGMLSHPVIYLSEYFNSRRSEYIERLSAVMEQDAFGEWFVFFLEGIVDQADRAMDLIDRLGSLRRELLSEERNVNVRLAIESLFRNPFVRVSDLAAELDVSFPTANKVIEELESRGMLRETTGQKRNRLYVADSILELLENRR